MKLLSVFSVTVFICAIEIDCYKHYQYDIPNGDRINHPCFPNKLWWGVGHLNQAGGGPRNPFGKDFVVAGHTWTQTLCRMDSDGDGLTNGEELGDPDCVWTKEEVATRTFNITHPGVCEPISSDKCKRLNGDWNLCVDLKFSCPAIERPEVENVTMKFKRTKVPSKTTSYFCQAFEFPADKPYHLIAHKPEIDNANMMHHIVVYGCETKPNEKAFKEPYECGMAGYGCLNTITLWTLGYPGDCLPEEYGMLVGKRGFRYFVLQYHWNNPAMMTDQYDSSGMTFYLTPNLRLNDGGTFVTGNIYLDIPKGRPSVIQTSVCSSNCTRLRLNQTLYFTDILAHMHYAGRKAEVIQLRKGEVLRKILPMSEVRYDLPQRFKIDPPVVFLPGDEIITTCDFRTVGLPHNLYYGDSTQDEMCFMFISFYPYQPFTNCVDYGKVDICYLSTVENGGDGGESPGRIGECHVGNFINTQLPRKWMPRVLEFCDISIDSCRPNCMEVVKELRESEPCWKDWARRWLEYISVFYPGFHYLKRLRMSVAPCEREIAVLEATNAARPPAPANKIESNLIRSSNSMFFIVGIAVVASLYAVIFMMGVVRMIKRR